MDGPVTVDVTTVVFPEMTVVTAVPVCEIVFVTGGAVLMTETTAVVPGRVVADPGRVVVSVSGAGVTVVAIPLIVVVTGGLVTITVSVVAFVTTSVVVTVVETGTEVGIFETIVVTTVVKLVCSSITVVGTVFVASAVDRMVVGT